MKLAFNACCLSALVAFAALPPRAQAPVASPSAPPAVEQPAAQTAAPPAVPHRRYEPVAEDFNSHDGYIQLFDGKSLADWEGDPKFWRVEDGAIVGESTAENRVQNTYIWRKGIVAHDFDLKLEIKCELNGGTGIQYRSHSGIPWTRPQPPDMTTSNLAWLLTGPQADFWSSTTRGSKWFDGQVYSENTPLGIIAWRGEVVRISPGVDPMLIGGVGKRDDLETFIKPQDWNQYEVVARGGTLIHIINGHVMAILIDDDAADSMNNSGYFGIELEQFPSKVSVRNIWLKKLN